MRKRAMALDGGELEVKSPVLRRKGGDMIRCRKNVFEGQGHDAAPPGSDSEFVWAAQKVPECGLALPCC
jgi:hypothetical protein